MIETQYITLDMKPSGVLPVLYCSQYDIGRPLGMVVYNSGQVVNLGDYTVTIEATRTDGTAITAVVTTDDNIGVFATTATMTNKADRYTAQLVLDETGGKRVASLPFVMCVIEAAMDENAESIEEDASLYQQYTEAVAAIIAGIRADVAATDAKADALDTRVTAHDGEIDNLQRYIIFPAMSPTLNPHGNCCAITHGTHAILFDLGRYVAFAEIRDTLLSYGIDTIDAVFISHYHGDHDGNPYEASYTVWSDAFDMTGCAFYLPLDPPSSISGWETTTETKLRAAFSGNSFYKPPYGDVIINGIAVEAFNNTASDYAYLQSQSVTDYNQYCQIFRAEYLGASVLILGDAGRAAQEYQYSLGNFKPTKILGVPHHGLEGDSLTKIVNVVSPQYAYISNGYSSNQFLRDMLLIALGDNGTTIIDNVATYPESVVGQFGATCTLSGGVREYTSYAGYGHNEIYFDATVSASAYQDGTEEHPFSSMRRVIVHCNGGYTTVYCKSDITAASGAIQITADNGYVEFMGIGHAATAVSFLLSKGARATFNSFAGILHLQLDDASFARVVACGTVGTMVVNESILVGSSTNPTQFSWRNAFCALGNQTYIGTGNQ